MRTLPLRPPVVPPPPTKRARRGAPKCGMEPHWGLRWSTLWGQRTREGFAGMGGWNRMRTQPLGPPV
eukprot:230085-Pyramimonas_sp.AAC.1